MELYIRPVPPFDLDLSAGIFSGGDERFQVYEGGTFRQAVSLGKRLALIKVRSLQTVEDPIAFRRGRARGRQLLKISTTISPVKTQKPQKASSPGSSTWTSTFCPFTMQ